LQNLGDDATVDFGKTVHPQPAFARYFHPEEQISCTRSMFPPSTKMDPQHKRPYPVTAMVPLLERSGCHLKIFNLHISVPPDDLSILFQVMPSLEHLQLHFWSKQNADGVMDDILARIFNSPPGNTTIVSEEASHKSFLPAFSLWNVCHPLPSHIFLGITYRSSIVSATGAR